MPYNLKHLLLYLSCLLLSPTVLYAEAESVKVYTISDGFTEGELSKYTYFFMDNSSRLKLADVINSQDFTLNSESSLGFGYSNASYWLRVSIQNLSHREQNIIFHIGYPLLDEIVFYKPNKGEYQAVASGDLRPFNTREFDYRNFAFSTSMLPKSEATFFIRVRSSSTVTVPLKIWGEKSFNKYIDRERTVAGFYYGCIIAILLYNLFLYVSTGARSYGSYVIFLSFSMLFFMAWMGTGTQYLWGNIPWLTQRAWPISGTWLSASIVLFETYFLGLRRNTPRIYRLFKFMLYTFFIIGLLNFYIPIKWAHILTFLSGTICSCIGYSVAIYLALKKQRQAIFFVIAWSVFFGFIITSAFTILGILQLPLAIGSFGAQIGSAIESILLSLGLADRINYLQKREIIQSQEIIANLRKINLLKEQLEKALLATKRMTETTDSSEAIHIASRTLNHEIKTPALGMFYFLEQPNNVHALSPPAIAAKYKYNEVELSLLEIASKHREPQITKQHLLFPVYWKDNNFGVFYAEFQHNNLKIKSEDKWFIETVSQSLAQALQNIFYQNHLKDLVDARTQELNSALRELKERQNKIDLILSHIQQGIFTFDEDLKIDSEYSSNLLSTFDVTEDMIRQAKATDLLFSNSNLTEDQKNMALEALRSTFGLDKILWESNIHHLPLRLEKKGAQQRFLEIEWMPISNSENKIDKVMVVAKDISERLRLEEELSKKEEQNQDFLTIIPMFMALDHYTLKNFFTESQKIYQSIIHDINRLDPDPRIVFRNLHTLKGMCRMLGFHDLSNIIHQSEEILAGANRLSEAKLAQLKEKSKEYLAAFKKYEMVYQQVFAKFERRLDHSSIMNIINELLNERFDEIRKSGHQLGHIIIHDEVLFWQPQLINELRKILLHIFNNSLDHGYFEAYKEASTKPKIEIKVSCVHQNEYVTIIFEDWGAGVNAEKLLGKAASLGIAQQNIVDLIFHDGVSTSTQSTLTSGRGVGMAAVKAKVEELHGSIHVEANQPQGTRFIIRFPARAAALLTTGKNIPAA